MTPKEAFQYSSSRKAGGGIVGGCLAYILVPAFGIIGAYIIDIIVLIITMVLITERSALKGVQKGSRKVYETARENTERYQEIREQRQEYLAAFSTDGHKQTEPSPEEPLQE